MKKRLAIHQRENIGFIIGAVVGLILLVIFLWPGQENFHRLGPMNTGHNNLNCKSCHKAAPGTARQQLQTKTRYLLGARNENVTFGHQKVDNMVCLECHERPNDRHPVFRFIEPRFKEAREHIPAQFCISCHQEHQGQRVTLQQTDYCVHCHQETRLKNDPISIPHQQLIADKQWKSCLGCHDFHGNHIMKTAINVSDTLAVKQILEYFRGGSSPYGKSLHFRAKEKGVSE